MHPKLPVVNLYLDAAGRFSKSESTPLVIAGFAIESCKVQQTREALLTVIEDLKFKWKCAYQDIPKAKKVFRLMVKRQLTADVVLIRKTQPHWDSYWNKPEDLYQKGVQKAQEAIPYAKPSTTLKYHLYGIGIARIVGFHLRRYKKQLLSKNAEPFTINITAICDSDIQGEKNQEMFQTIFELMGDLPKLRTEANVLPNLEVHLKTEDEEPLLLLPDFLAGFVYSKAAYGNSTENEWKDLLLEIEKVYSQWPDHSLIYHEMPFELDYLIPEETFNHVIPKRDRERLLAETHVVSDAERESTNRL